METTREVSERLGIGVRRIHYLLREHMAVRPARFGRAWMWDERAVNELLRVHEIRPEVPARGNRRDA